MSETPDSTLADLQQIIADLKRQLAESNAERDEAFGREAAGAEVLQVINSSPGHLAPVFDAMLDKALRLCGAALGILHTIDGERSHIAAHRGVSPTFAEFLTGRPHEFSKTGPGLIGQLLRGERVIHHDAAESEGYRSGAPIARALVELEGARSVLAVPLSKDNALLGMLVVYRREVRPFTDKQIALLQNFAAQAVIAIENARLITETREALEQQTATAEVLQVINSSPGDLAPVFDAILEKALRLCSAAHGSLFTLVDGTLHQVASVHATPQLVALREQQGPNRLEPGHAFYPLLEDQRIIHLTDVRESASYRDFPAIRERLDAANARSMLAVALRKDEALLGVLDVYRQEVQPFSDKQIALLENFAAQAVIAMENARLMTETREALEQQTATAEVLGVINSSPGDLAPVFDAILEKAHALCGASTGSLQLFDGEFIRAVATRGLPDEFVNITRQPRRSGSLDAFLGGASFVQFADLADPVLTGRDQTLVAAHDIAGVRTYLRVPLRKDDALLGFIGAGRREVRPFTDKQIALLQNFAAQAVIAMENARLITETREALEQQTATAEVLQVINASPGDLAPVFDAMLQKALNLCGADLGGLYRFDGKAIHPVAMQGGPKSAAELLQQSFVIEPGSSVERLIRGEVEVVQVPDIVDTEAYRSGSAYRVKFIELTGARTALWVALRQDEALVGVFVIYRQEVRPFSHKQIALLQNFAAQAVIAMENARLITETREALEQQTATAEVLQVINSSPGDLTPVFEAILEKAHNLCGAAYGGLVIRDTDGFRAVAARGDPGLVERWQQVGPLHPPDGSPLSRLMLGEKIIHLADAPADDNYRNTAPPDILRLGEFCGLRTLLMVPLRTDNTFLGVITAFRLEVQPFTDQQIALLQNFAAQAVIAMENARLLGELRQRTEEVGELNRDLEARVAEQVDELGRVGRLKRFLAPQLAEMIVSQGDEKILESHRREIVVVFCDLRGYTAFTETAEPEEVLDFLSEYHGALGPLVSQFEGTLDQFSGDGIMVFFNDPIPCPDPAERAVKMAMAMREAARELIAAWSRHGCELGFGIGIAQGYATLGQIGFSERSGYTAIGTVCNLAARLCAEAQDGQILVSSRVAGAVGALAKLEDLGNVELKGLRRPVAAFNVAQSTSPAEARPNLTVVTSAPGA